MDISFPLDGYHVNFRVAGIVQHDNKMLFHKEEKHEYYALMGGRIQTGESSIEAIKREVYEETGKKIEVLELICMVENFFKERKENYHEFLLVYKIEFVEEKDKKILEAIPCIEEGKTLCFDWIEIQDLENKDVRPKVIKQIVKENRFPVHYINDELEKEIK